MLDFRPTVYEIDLRAIAEKPRDIEKAAPITPIEFVAMIRPLATRGGTWFDGEEPVIAAGLTTIKPQVAYAWLMASCDIRPHLRSVLPVVKRYLAEAEGIQVVTGVTRGGHKDERWCRHLGFRPGPMMLPGARTYFLSRK